MAIKMNPNVPNQIIAGTVIYAEKQRVDGIGLLVKGKVAMYNSGMKLILNQGSFLGICDLVFGEYISTYIAVEDCIIYSFDVIDLDSLDKVFSMGKDYSGLISISLTRQIVEAAKIYDELFTVSKSIYDSIVEKYDKYKEISKRYGQKIEDIPGAREIRPIEDFDVNEMKLEYYKNVIKLPLEVQKQYFGTHSYITRYHLEEQGELLKEIIDSSIEMAEYISKNIKILVNDGVENIFKGLAKLALDINKAGGRNNDIVDEIDEIIVILNSAEVLFIQKLGKDAIIDRSKLEELYFNLISTSKKEEDSTGLQLEYTKNELNNAEDELRGSLDKILIFSEIGEEKSEKMHQLINTFKITTDKMAADNESRMLRKKLADLFYELYELVFIKAAKTGDNSRLIDMFLKYGYVDENLLTKEQLMELYYLKEIPNNERCKVYNVREWLTEIYEGRKEPSRNEFDMDYVESLRELKKTTKMTEEEQKDYLNNMENKLFFEIRNMFRSNHKLVSGQITVFVPILHKDMFIKTIKKSYVSTTLVNRAIDDIVSIDYSAFYREVLYVDAKKGIEKERIMKEVMPDIILMPTCGIGGVMWQETATKKKDTKARFLLPIFCSVSIDDILVSVVAKYRWEICRSIQGLSWNDIREKSLTSEYSDYIQFYRKQKDLTEQAKEKIRNQIQKGRNNLREIFSMDYEVWIKSESKGGIRLNKVVRNILYMNCPFNKEIREKLKNQPAFTEIANKYNALTMKKAKDIENHYISLKKNNVEITEELETNLKFYKEL